MCISAQIYLGRLIAEWNYLPWQSMVLGKQRVIILLSHKWDLKGLLYLCFPCPPDRSRKRCCSLSVACLFPGPGGVGDLLGGAPQSPWYCEGPSSCVTAFQECREGRKVLCFVDILLKPSCQEEEEAAWSRLPVVAPHLAAFLLFYPLMPLSNFLAVILHGMLFSPHFRPCSSSTREPLFSWSAVSECSEKHCGSCLCLRLCLGMSPRGSVWPAPSELSSRAVGGL